MSKKLSAPIDFYFWAGAINLGMLAMAIAPNLGSWVLAQETKPQVQQTVTTGDKELRAFADVIGHAEGTGKRYDLLMGFGTFTDFSKHPDQCVGFFNPATQKPDCSTAAGRYQYITTTWNEKAQKVGVTDFSKQSQDTVLFYHLNELGIPQLLKQGRFEDALARAAPIWVSLYPNSSKQRVAPFEELKAVYNKSLARFKK